MPSVVFMEAQCSRIPQGPEHKLSDSTVPCPECKAAVRLEVGQ